TRPRSATPGWGLGARFGRHPDTPELAADGAAFGRMGLVLDVHRCGALLPKELAQRDPGATESRETRLAPRIDTQANAVLRDMSELEAHDAGLLEDALDRERQDSHRFRAGRCGPSRAGIVGLQHKDVVAPPLDPQRRPRAPASARGRIDADAVAQVVAEQRLHPVREIGD